MTISAQRRLADQEFVLKTLAGELGEEMMSRKWWDTGRADFADVIPTTWAELEERGLIRRHRRQNPPPAYELSEAGWVAGLRLAGVIDSEPFRARCIDLVKYFKGEIAGRRLGHDAFVSHHAVHERFGLSWALNVLRSGLLQQMFPDKRMNATWDSRQTIFRVPVTFGMPK